MGKVKPYEDRLRSTTKKLRQPQTRKTMNSNQDWTHEVLQRLIIIFLGLLTLGAYIQI
jgi:hypothetical protein